jgi:heme/copper-type cytochrome/quinol oxidase subunit 4
MASGIACVCRDREGRYQFMKWLIAIGLALIVVGLLWPWLSKHGLGRLPGDIAIERGNLRLYFPITTCLIVSVVVSFVFWLLNR